MTALLESTTDIGVTVVVVKDGAPFRCEAGEEVYRSGFNAAASSGLDEMRSVLKASAALESAGYEHSATTGWWVRKDAPAVGDVHVNKPLGAVKPKQQGEEDDPREEKLPKVPTINKADVVPLDVPLLLRLLEEAREDIASDEPLHVLAERLITLSADGKPLTMADWPKILESIKKADDDGEEHWVTINGNSILIGADGEPKAGNPKAYGGSSSGTAFKPSAKMARAMQAYNPCNADKQRLADAQERIVSKALGVERTRDNSAFDLNNGKIAIELKTMIDSKNGKITMSRQALARKTAEIADRKLKAFTVVADRRGGSTQYYYSRGVGSFRISSMIPATLSELKGIIRK